MKDAIVYREREAKRLADTVRRVEALPHGPGRPAGSAGRAATGLPLMYGLAVDDHDGESDQPNAILVNLCRQDGTSADTDRTITLCFHLPTDGSDPADLAAPAAVVAAGSVLAFLPFWDVTNDCLCGLVVGIQLGTDDSPYSMLPAAGDRVSEAEAQVDTWDRDDPPEGKSGVAWHGLRVTYSTTDKKFYLFDRPMTWDSAGNLRTLGAETKREIIDLVDCTSA